MRLSRSSHRHNEGCGGRTLPLQRESSTFAM